MWRHLWMGLLTIFMLTCFWIVYQSTNLIDQQRFLQQSWLVCYCTYIFMNSPKNSTSKVIPSYPRNVPYTWTKSETFPDFLTLWGRCRLSLPRPWHTEAIQNKLRMFRTRFVVVMNHLRPSENNCGLITQCRYQRSNINFRGQFHHIWVIPRCLKHLLKMLRSPWMDWKMCDKFCLQIWVIPGF